MHAVRFRPLAVTALVGLLVLTGCARNTDEALRVGDLTLDIEQVDAAAAPILANLGAVGAEDAEDAAGEVRQSVVQLTVFNEIARRYAREKGITLPAPDYAAAAEVLQVGEDDQFARLNAEATAYVNALSEDADARTPTDAEMREVYGRFIALAGPDAATYEQIRNELLGFPEYGQSLTLRDELTDAANRYGVTINPRYQPVEFPLMRVSVANGELVLVNLPLGEQGTGAVRPAG